MKKTIFLIVATLLLGINIQAQDHIVHIDSVNMTDSMAYCQIIKIYSDTTMAVIDLKLLQPDIINKTHQVKYLWKSRQAIRAEYKDTTYSDSFRTYMNKDLQGINSRLIELNRNRLELIAIRDSIISFVK